MDYTVLRGTGATVSRICLGTMTFGKQVDEAAAQRLVDMSIDLGINFIDTADMYVDGLTEEILGKCLKGKRDKIVLASKVCNYFGGERNRDEGLHRWHVIRGIEDCLRRLKVDCLDIAYLHKPDRKTPLEETLAAFDYLVQQGKVMYVAMSNYAAWQMCEALWTCDKRHWAKPVMMQQPYNLITRSLDVECVEFSETHNMGMVVYNALAAGLLTGKHESSSPIAGTRFDYDKGYAKRYWSDTNFDALAELSSIAKEAGISLHALALQWLKSRPYVDSILLGASKPEHLEQNVKLFLEGDIDADTAAACDTVWQKIRGAHFQYNR
ncbi:aldo/keto reductase [Puniceicoccaceae bacterium K14]|nr:aldo/keto reductase [Puniceicoccaceae bacterium K14]